MLTISLVIAFTKITFDNNLSSENITFTGNENYSRNLTLYKNVNISKAIMNFSGYDNGGYPSNLYLEIGNEDGIYEWSLLGAELQNQNAILDEFNDTITNNVLAFYENITIEEEREAWSTNDCKGGCGNSYDEDWTTYDRPYDNPPYLSYIYENFTIPHWTTSASWIAKTGFLVGTRPTYFACWTGSSFSTFASPTCNGCISTITIPSNCLTDETLIIRTHISESGAGSTPESIYYEGNVTFKSPSTYTKYLKIPKHANVESAYLNFSGFENYVMNSLFFTPKDSVIYNGIFYNGSIFWTHDAPTAEKYNASGSYIIDGFDVGVEDATVYGFKQFNSSFYYFVGDSTNKIYVVYNDEGSAPADVEYDVQYQTTSPRGIWFNGTYFWITSVDGVVYRYNSSGAYTGWNFNVSELTTPYDIQFKNDYFWISDYNDGTIHRYDSDGNYDNFYINLSQGESDYVGFHIDNDNVVWTIALSEGRYRVYRNGNNKTTTNPYLDIGDDGSQEWNYTGVFNIKNNKSSDFSSTLNTYLSTCTADSENYCDIPFKFSSDTIGILRVNDIIINYNNISQLDFTTTLNNILDNGNCTNGTLSDKSCIVSFKLHSDTAGDLQYSNINITYIGDSYPNLTINSPTGTLTSKTININLTIEEDYLMSYCYYNITRGASVEVSNTAINCSNPITTSIVTSDADYVFNIWINDSENQINSSSTSFTVDTSGDRPSGGGGGGAPQQVVVIGEGAFWTMETEGGGSQYQLNMVQGTTRIKSLLFENLGVTTREIKLSCEDIENKLSLCDYVEFEESVFTLPLVQEIKTKIDFTITLKQIN